MFEAESVTDTHATSDGFTQILKIQSGLAEICLVVPKTISSHRLINGY